MKTHEKFKSEKQLTNYILKMLNGDANKDVFAYKRHGGQGNEAGKPDITGIVAGMRLELEVKDPARMTRAMRLHMAVLEGICKGNIKDVCNSRLASAVLLAENKILCRELLSIASKRQQYWLKKFEKLGAISMIVCSPWQVALAIGVARRFQPPWSRVVAQVCNRPEEDEEFELSGGHLGVAPSLNKSTSLGF